MKIQQSDIGRFLQLVCKMWKSNYEGYSQIVVFTVTERACSIAMAREGLLLTYLCNRVDSETSEQVIAAPFGLLQDCSGWNGIVDLQEVEGNGASYIAAAWGDGVCPHERQYLANIRPDDRLILDLAWHTVDERNVGMLRPSVMHTNQERRVPNNWLANRPVTQ